MVTLMKFPIESKSSKNSTNISESLPSIDLSSKEEIWSLVTRGISIRNVFFKSIQKETYNDFSRLFGDVVRDRGSYKHTARTERSVLVRYDSKSLVGEFIQLIKMHEVVPTNIARPIAITTWGSNVVGYFVEYIDGKPLEHFEFGFIKTVVLNTIIPMINKMNSNGVGHGDITLGDSTREGNIKVASNGEIKVFDPLPSYKDIDDKFRIEADQSSITKLLRIYNK